MREPFYIKKIAVLGAGVMGAQIAAHCVNAGFETLLYDLAAKEGSADSIVDKAIAHLAKLKPAPLGATGLKDLLQARNYDEHLDSLGDCDLVIEAIAERMDWKEALYQRVEPFLAKDAVLVTNTSGLSIDSLSEVLPSHRQKNFCGVHFFNPPRYMHLAELIPSKQTQPKLLDNLETWLTRYVGKGVVRAKDTPNFIANRVGVFSLLATMHHAMKFDVGLDEVDAITGVLLGRPKSATFRTMDVVGLDTMAHVVKTMDDELKEDPWHALYTLPEWLVTMIEAGHLGQKTGQGIYQKNGKVIEVFDLNTKSYRPSNPVVSDRLAAILAEKDLKQRMMGLLQSDDKQARFLAACFLDLFHYCAYHLADIANNVRDVDLAIRWGFGWSQGPFETWQLSGIDAVTQAIEKNIAQKIALAPVSLPGWVAKTTSFYSDKGAYAPEDQVFEPRSSLPVYKRQFYPANVLGEQSLSLDVIYENDGLSMSHFKEDTALISFKSKANTIGQEVLDGMVEALDKAQARFQGVIIYQHNAGNFSSGADLKGVAKLIQDRKFDSLDKMVAQFQQVALQLKYSSIPTVAAVRGRALGGGCELMMHCSSVVAAFESYPGLVEAGVGVIPAGGGCKEMALRAAQNARQADLMAFIQPVFQNIAMAQVAASAIDAKQMGYLLSSDSIIMNQDEVLFAALAKVKSMQAANYVPPLPQKFKVAGIEGHARLQVGLVNWLEGGFISPFDYLLANQLAHVLCGGDVNQNTLVDESWMLHLEREAFVLLTQTEQTQAKIKHLLETGKPLRN